MGFTQAPSKHCVCVCICVCVFACTFTYSNWRHAYEKHFNLKSSTFSLTYSFSGYGSGKKRHWTSHSAVGVLCRLFHITPGVGLGGLFHGIFTAELQDWKWKSSQGLFYYHKKQRVYYWGLRIVLLFWVGLCVCVCLCFGSCLAERGRFRCTCRLECWDGECFQSATGGVREERCLSCKRLWAQ